MVTRHGYKYLLIAAVLAGICIVASPVGAVDQSEDIINYAYSNWIGSGFYKIDDRTVYLLRAPFSYTLKEADSENWGMALLFPATIGFHNFSEGEDNYSYYKRNQEVLNERKIFKQSIGNCIDDHILWIRRFRSGPGHVG